MTKYNRYHRIDIGKATIYITNLELASLLHKDEPLFREVLRRGKIFKRVESKQVQYAKKLSESESQELNDLLDQPQKSL